MVLEKPELLKEWLITTLRKMCDADPVALGKYILALVKKDKKDLKSFLSEQLEVFLLDDTSKFVELLLETLLTKSYLKPASSDVPLSTDSSHPNSRKAADATENKMKANDISDTSPSSITDKFPLKRKNALDDDPSTNKKEPYTPSSSSKDALSKEEYVPTACKTASSHEVKYKPSSKKAKHCDTSSPDGKEKSPEPTLEPKLKHHPNKDKKQNRPIQQSTRCKDYDEKGYCLLGNFCGFDHGNDPILVENLKSVNFGVNLAPSGPSSPPPLPPLPPAVPRLPPPPLPPPEYAEPYNPESPGMNLVAAPLSYFDTSVPPPPLPPIHHHHSSVGEPNPYFGKPDLVYNKPKPQGRVRELISVDASTKYSNPIQNKDNGTRPKLLSSVSKESSNQTHAQGDFKGRRFDFSRLGPCPRTTLEIRKIPSKQNTIKNLYQHFSKHGNIINIEVSYDNDPEAAIVTFSTNSEATAAYRSTEAILDNRFIKVFWNNDGQRRKINPNFLKEINSIDFSTPPVAENDKSMPLRSNEGRVLEVKVNEKPFTQKTNPRSVYVCQPAAENVKKVFSKSNVKKATEQEGDIAAHKLKLNQAKTELLHKTVKDQKLILDQLTKATTKKQKVFLKKALDSISKQVEELTKDLKKQNEDLKAFLKTPTQIPDSRNATKELLDAELELYKKQHTNSDEDTTELLMKKVNFMKSQAKALGLIPRGPKSVFRRKINSRYSLSVDHRTKKTNPLSDTQADVSCTTDTDIIDEKEPDDMIEMQSLEVDDEEEDDKEDSEARSWRH
ncbi:hypothetical protein JTE90_010190 [Oedothorax gibbosus]|uniref:RNA-binding protein 26 n=1 Tax=Oedothorax gibbosus TaxID=931172 RepID=A0AAV6UKB6_9ARAC|nr:hypothetical protein JTE90_010190 [Oedothorax gibbosus]